MENGVLNSWKEIAAYTGRGIRTVQRWEVELGFPVRRPRGKHRSAVIAIRQEIDLWMRTSHGIEAGRKAHVVHVENQMRLLDNTHALQLRTTELLSRSEVLRQRMARAVELGTALKTSWKTARTDEKKWSTEPADGSHLVKKNMGRAAEPDQALKNSTPRTARPFANPHSLV